MTHRRPALDQVRRFRALQSQGTALPYEELAEPNQQPDYDMAVEILEEGWQLSRFPRISVRPPIAWDTVASENRSWEFCLHSWDFLAPVLTYLTKTHDDELLAFAVEVAEDWATNFPTIETTSRMAWYDMAIGIRAYRLSFILDLAARNLNISDEAIANLIASIETHMAALRSDEVFKPHTNHGFYVAAGQAAMSRRLSCLAGMGVHQTEARERLREMLSLQFSTEGVHREHSPAYHRMVLDTVRGLSAAELLPLDEMSSVEDIEDALAWFVLPNGRLATFGDSPRQLVSYSDNYVSEALRFVTSGGREGSPPNELWRSFHESGYAMYRDGWPNKEDDVEDWTYLALNAAFHSRTQKHADDLSFIWYTRGREILIDPGRFGYLDPTPTDSELGQEGFYHSHPMRVYVEETRAHNAVEIDGESYQRRGVEPYGSGIKRVGMEGGVFYAEAHAVHLTLDRAFRIEHSRLLLAKSNEWLVVYDFLSDPRNSPHDYRQWFQFDPSLILQADDLGWSSALGSEGTLWVIPLLEGSRSIVYRGVEEPHLQGWVSLRDQEFEPTDSVYIEVAEAPSTHLATLFVFADDPPVPQQCEVGDRSISFAWSTSRSTNHVDVGMGSNTTISVEHTLSDRGL